MVKKTSALDGSGRGRHCSAGDPKRGRVRGSHSGSSKRVWGAEGQGGGGWSGGWRLGVHFISQAFIRFLQAWGSVLGNNQKYDP